MHPSPQSADDLLARALELKSEDPASSRDYLRKYLLHRQALLSLARATDNSHEAFAAAELALQLEPDSDIAQRTMIEARDRMNIQPPNLPERAKLAAKVPLITGMTYAQARAVSWTFDGSNRPIGELLDSGAKTDADLYKALVKAYVPKFRDAARTILLTKLTEAEPAEPPKPLRVIAGSRYTERTERFSLALASMAMGAGFTLAVLIVVLGTVAFFTKLPLLVSLSIYALMAVAWLLFRYGERRMEEWKSYRTGRLGEERVVEALRYALDGRWTLIRNFIWPGRKGGDIDLVLLGPGGVYALEVKAYSGECRVVGDTWERKGKHRWFTLLKSPGKQARGNAELLQNFLKQEGVAVKWVNPIVIWAGDEAVLDEDKGTLTVDKPQTPVWKTTEIEANASALLQQSGLDEHTLKQAIASLSAAVEQAVQREAPRSERKALRNS